MSFHSPKRVVRRSISHGKTQLDEEILELYDTIIKKKQSGYSIEELLPHTEENFKYIYYILTKMNKTDKEIFLVKLYLQNLDKFISIFHDATMPLKDLLDKIASQILVENYAINNIICKTGDKGDKVYIILKGSVSVLLQKEKMYSLSKIDYICYLVKLHLFQENELISKILLVNKEKYNIDERELNALFSMFHLYKFYIENKLKRKYSLFTQFYMDNETLREQIKYKYDVVVEKILHLGGMDDFMMNDIWKFYNLTFDAIIENYNKKNEISFKNVDNKINSPRRIKKPIKGNIRGSIKRKSTESLIEQIISSPSLPIEIIYLIDKENYKRRIIPDKIEKSDLIEFKLYEYIEITNLTEGEIFGEIALQNASKKRTATIITNEECIFGTLTKNLYNFCLKSTQEKLRNIIIQFFLNGPIFKGVNQPIFEGKYYNWFIKKKYKNRTILFKQGEKRKKIFFIKKGELELNAKMSFIDLNKIIEYNGGSINDYNAKKYCYESVDFNKFYNDDIHYFKIGCFKDNEIIGLDYFLKNDKFICDCEVYSITCSVFELENNLYLNLLNEPQLKMNIEKYNEQKKKILCDRLINIRDTKIENEINNIRITNRGKENNTFQNKMNKKGNLVLSLMKSVQVNKSIKLIKLSEIDIPYIVQQNRKTLFPENKLSFHKQFNTISNDRDISKLNHSSLKNNENNFVIKKNKNYNISNNNNEDKQVSFTNLKYFKRKNFSISEAKNVLNKKPLLSLKALRTKELLLPKRNNLKVVKRRYNERKLINKEEEFYMTHTHVFSNILNSDLKKRNDNIVDVLMLDNWAQKHYQSPQVKKTYFPKLKIKSKSFNYNI